MYLFVSSRLPYRVMSQLEYLGEATGTKGGERGSLYWMLDLDKFREEVPEAIQDKLTLTPITIDCRGKLVYALTISCEGFNGNLRSIK